MLSEEQVLPLVSPHVRRELTGWSHWALSQPPENFLSDLVWPVACIRVENSGQAKCLAGVQYCQAVGSSKACDIVEGVRSGGTCLTSAALM